jgi:hypothetical protein
MGASDRLYLNAAALPQLGKSGWIEYQQDLLAHPTERRTMTAWSIIRDNEVYDGLSADVLHVGGTVCRCQVTRHAMR